MTLGMFIGPVFAQPLDKGISPESKEPPLEKRERELETENKFTLKV
ncbi:unnamed protein product, partial [marine sediment metagenome]